MFRTCVISSAMQCHSFCCHLFSFSFSHRVFRVASNKYPVPMCALRSARLTLYRVPKLAVWSLRLSECYFSMSKSFQRWSVFVGNFFAHGVIPFGITNWLPTISIVVNISLHVCEKISSSFFYIYFSSLRFFRCFTVCYFYVMHLEFLGKLKQRW